MNNTIDRTAAIGLNSFGKNVINYLQTKRLKNLTLYKEDKTLTDFQAPIPVNPDTKITKTVLFITDVTETPDLNLISEYKPEFPVDDLFKIAVLLLPAGVTDYTADKNIYSFILNLKADTNAVVLVSQESDNTPEQAVFEVIKNLHEVITRLSEVNVDFEDLKTVLDGRIGMVGTAEGNGEDRALEVARLATSAPIMHQFYGSPCVLLSISTGPIDELEMEELTTMTDYIQEKFGEESEVIFGHGLVTELGNKISALLIAATPAPELVVV